MKTNIIHLKFLNRCLALLALLIVVQATTVMSAGRNPNPRVLPPHSNAYGQSYGGWANAWWQWALSIPADQNPLIDETGEFCGVGQDGPVWFLPGTFGSDANRDQCSVPKGKALFFPVYNWLFGAGIFDCEPTVPGVECDIEALRQGAAEQTETAEILEVMIDGVPLQNLRDYRASSPEPFALVYPENNVVEVPAGEYYPHVTDGYWLMLSPLPVGEHTIRTFVSAPDTLFGLIEFEVITHFVVE